ncbi:peptidase family M3 [Pochonia chlamydosporia 170]|uniref:Peptidase family M3 n=1 Tax=Pochonia chlamydosporia 170 TaxID=1380566 RepID=A0A179FG66_METCM|nr:peptidase family M3 [Pochonia chlamydosporia 170]OAQ64338.1 peptidase family M3 [Pochonia chlamydosporia 170]
MFQDKLQPLPRLPRQDEILTIAQCHVSEHRKVIADNTTSVSISSACFDNVLGPIAEIENRQSGERAVILALRYTAVDIVTQEVVEEAERMWLKYSAEVDQNLTLFKLLHAIQKKHESLDSESQKLLDRFLMQYTECGHGSLDSRSIQEWQDNRQIIEALCADFNRNVRQLNSNAISIHFTQEELDGVPTHDLEEYPLSDGVRRIPLQWRPYVSILRHAHNLQTRKRIQLAWGQRLPQNVQLFRRIISLRHKNARLRGYKTHAASRLPYRMAMSIDWVENLLEDLSKALIEVGKRNFAQLQQKKNEVITKDKDTSQNAKIEAWDVPYYNRLIDNKATVDQDKVMEYFPLTQTFKSILDLFSTYLQLRFEQLPAETVAGHIWAPEVQVWSVWDKRPGTKNDFIGYLYIDILGRTNKYKGNQAVNLQPVRLPFFFYP